MFRSTASSVSSVSRRLQWALAGSFALLALLAFAAPAPGATRQPKWIWSAAHTPGRVPPGACHFRKTISLQAPERVVVAIAADDEFELYLNGRRVATGGGRDEFKRYNVSPFVRKGNNIFAVRVNNHEGGAAGLASIIYIKERGRGWVKNVTDDSWKTNLSPLPFWTAAIYNDSGWPAARPLDTGSSEEEEAASEPEVVAQSTDSSSVDAGQTAEPAPRVASRPSPAARPQTPETSDASEEEGEAASSQSVMISDDGPSNESLAAPDADSNLEQVDRFLVSREFRVTQVAKGAETGSLIAMSFNEFGHIVASRENGPLVLIYDSNGDQRRNKVRIYCDKVKNVQGILCLNGNVYVTADGPDGAGLHRLADAAPGEQPDGLLDEVETLIDFKGKMGEHGPHGLVLGPDGMIYLVAGNHCQTDQAIAATSPYKNYYEGDLLQPRYEDPTGHASGVKAPGGVILRTGLDGEKLEVVAGGLRNAYDLAFNREGELFVHDSDMESDMGTTWYRPTRLYHVVPGGEYGWRSGWSKWPEYFVDCLPPILDTGRGSPTGAVCYNHHSFPARYHNALFLGDWSEGRILVAKPQRNGAGYEAKSEVFLQGQPLNVTDVEVGPDGDLYFCTGGRGTEGGIYRVSWRGQAPESVTNLGEGVEAIIRQPQLQSAWGRQTIASERNDMLTEWKKVATDKEDDGADQADSIALDRWRKVMTGVAKSTKNPSHYRIRALDLMSLFGTPPSDDLLETLSAAEDAEVRAKAVELMAASGSQFTQRLLELLSDDDGAVRRKACEGLARLRRDAPLADLKPLLASDDRNESWAARRALEEMDDRNWRDEALAWDDHSAVIQASVALMSSHPTRKNAEAVLEKVLSVIGDTDQFVSDEDFIDMLRVIQLALLQGEFSPADAPDVRSQLTMEYPAGDPVMNRELIRLLAYLQADSILDRYLNQLSNSRVDQIDKVHLAFHLRFLNDGWTAEQKFSLLEFLDEAENFDGGGSYAAYVRNVARDFSRSLTADEAAQVLAEGARWPSAALGALYKLPTQLDDDMFDALVKLDDSIKDMDGASVARLKMGLVAVLARDGSVRSMDYLRKVWEQDPERRSVAAMGLAQKPHGENWHFLVRSLPVLKDEAGREVLTKLREVNLGPEGAEHYRQAILLGLRLGENGAKEAVRLLEFWTGERHHVEGESWDKAIASWQRWFHQTYPEMPEAKLPDDSNVGRWKYDELLDFLATDAGRSGSPSHGAVAFTTAQCSKCHRHGSRGESLGPDLTNISKRFSRAEMLEAILYPSHIISDQYASKTIVTMGGRAFTGLVSSGPDGSVTVLQSDGRKITMKEDEIDEINASRKSSMPDGLLNELDLQDIADLFAFLTNGARSEPRPIQDDGSRITRRAVITEAK